LIIIDVGAPPGLNVRPTFVGSLLQGLQLGFFDAPSLLGEPRPVGQFCHDHCCAARSTSTTSPMVLQIIT